MKNWINIGHISLSVTAQWHFNQPQCNKSGLTSIVSNPAKRKQAALLHKPFLSKAKMHHTKAMGET